MTTTSGPLAPPPSPITLVDIVDDLDSVHCHRLSTVFSLQLDQDGLVAFQLHFFGGELFHDFVAGLVNLILLNSELGNLLVLLLNLGLKFS